MRNNFFFIVLLIFFISTYANAQVEISPYLDKNGVLNGINYAKTATVDSGFGWFSYYAAIEACRNLVYDGKRDWYLPTWDELSLFLPTPQADFTLPQNPTGKQADWAMCTPPDVASDYNNTFNILNSLGCRIAIPGMIEYGDGKGNGSANTFSRYALPSEIPYQPAGFHQAIRAAGNNYKAGMVFAALPLKLYSPHYNTKMIDKHTSRPFYLIGLYPQSVSFFTVQCVR